MGAIVYYDVYGGVPITMSYGGRMPITMSYGGVAVPQVWRSINLRETICQLAATVQRRPYQRIQELISIRMSRNFPTPEALAKLYEQHVAFSSSSEKVTLSFVRAALVVWDKLLCHDVLRSMIVHVEETLAGRSPFDSVYKMEAIITKAKDIGKISWCVAALADMVQDHLCGPGELSVRNLTGKGIGNRGVLDLLLYKKDAVEFLLKSWVCGLALGARRHCQVNALGSIHPLACLQRACNECDTLAVTSLTSAQTQASISQALCRLPGSNI